MIIPYKIKQVKDAYIKFEQPWDKSFKCNFCDKEYADMSGRRRHEKNNHIEKDEKFKCNLCDKEYNSRDTQKRHQKINHSSVASVCESKCDTPYNDGKTLELKSRLICRKLI